MKYDLRAVLPAHYVRWIAGVALCMGMSARLAAENTPSRFTDNGDGTVTDHALGVMWMQSPLEPNEDDPVPYASTQRGFGWELARSRARTASFAGHNDWRLPTVDELHSLVDCRGGTQMPRDRRQGGGWCVGNFQRPTIDQRFFPDTPPRMFWASRSDDRYHAWAVDFSNGMAQSVVKGSFNSVRLARTQRP